MSDLQKHLIGTVIKLLRLSVVSPAFKIFGKPAGFQEELMMLGYRLVFTSLPALLFALVPLSATKVRPACERVTPIEVAAITHAGALEVDTSSSGPTDDGTGADACSWRIKGSKGTLIEMGVQQADDILAAFSARKIETFGHSTPPESIPLGDEALYRDFEHAKGGALLLRRGKQIFWCSGVVSKDSYVALAKLVLQRW